jgi:hypothetical protein
MARSPPHPTARIVLVAVQAPFLPKLARRRVSGARIRLYHLKTGLIVKCALSGPCLMAEYAAAALPDCFAPQAQKPPLAAQTRR